MVDGGKNLDIKGERFSVLYKLNHQKEQALELAKQICYEQTVEFPEDLIADGDIKDLIVGQIESITSTSDNSTNVLISYAVEVTGMEFNQFLNTIFGNISILPGIRVMNITIPDCMQKMFKGPRFGINGVSAIFNNPERPLVCSALKPLGLSAVQLAKQAYDFAAGGIDMIKDDHGITNQIFAPFKERLERCADAVNDANAKYGTKTLYLPNISGPLRNIVEWAHMAKEAGAGGLLIAPGLVSWDIVKTIAEDDSIELPVMAHPAFSGTYVLSPHTGISHGVLYGLLTRLAGADMSVFPNYGGRFSFSKEDCKDIVSGCTKPFSNLKPVLPSPGGGMTMDRIKELFRFYGKNFVMLIGGGIHRYTSDLKENSRYFMNEVKKVCPNQGHTGEKTEKKL